MDDGSGLGDDFDGERSEPCCSGLALASSVLDCESDEQQIATQEWRNDASALRPEMSEGSAYHHTNTMTVDDRSDVTA